MKKLTLLIITILSIVCFIHLSKSVYYTLHPTEEIIKSSTSLSHKDWRVLGLTPAIGDEYSLVKQQRVLKEGHWIYIRNIPVDTLKQMYVTTHNN